MNGNGWEVAQRVSRAPEEAPIVSVYTNGSITWNKLAQERLGNPESVVLLIDRKGKRIGIKPGQGANAFRVRPKGKNYFIPARATIQANDLRSKVSARANAEVKDDILAVQMEQLFE